MGNAPKNRKIRVAVIYGGRSGEHEISLLSAASVIKNLDRDRFEVLPVGIDKDGRWHVNRTPSLEGVSAIQIAKDSPEVMLPPYRQGVETGLVPLGGQEDGQTIDVVFPVMHGPLCEDGSIQGLLNMSNIPYVGAGVLGSAICMDKVVAKRLAESAGIPVAKYLVFQDYEMKSDPETVEKMVERMLGFPVFVKPANMGSSVGIHKVKKKEDLKRALLDAYKYDRKVLIEEGLDVREIEFSVLEDPKLGKPPRVSVPGEIRATREFYSYEAKYLDENGAELIIPAAMSDAQVLEGQELARKIFTILECEGMARVDLFLDKKTGRYVFNEVNTIPGFTKISMYPKLWEASGLSYSQLLTTLIELAIQRHGHRQSLSIDWKEGT